MKNLFRIVQAVLALCSGCSKQPQSLLPPTEFTQEYAQALQRASPGLKVEVVGDRELKVTSADRLESRRFLYNAYDAYKQVPGEKDAVIQQFVSASLEIAASARGSIDRSRIVPVIKD